MPYPIVVEVVLPPVVRDGRLRRIRRNETDLPKPQLGAVYVFKASAGYVEYGQRHLDYADDVVVGATEAYLVQTRPSSVVAEVTLRSAVPDCDYQVRVTFRCRVVDAAAVVAATLTDVDAILANHVGEDPGLHRLARRSDPEVDSLATVRAAVETRIRAYCEVAPPEVDGLVVSLSDVHLAVAPVAVDLAYLDPISNGEWL